MSKRAEQLLGSDVFVALVSPSYITDVKNKDMEITEQISIAKEFDKPTFLIYLSLSEEEIKEADELFKEHKVIKTLSTTREQFDKEVGPFTEALKTWCDQNLGNKKEAS